MKRTALFLSLLIATLKFPQAQPSLGIFSNSIIVSQDTVSFNDTVSFTFDVINTGDQVFFGKVIINYSVNNIFQGMLDSTNGNVQIDSLQSLQVTVTNHEITPPMYTVGDNIVVIWPVAEDVPTTDSGLTHIIVDTPLATGPPILRQQIKAFYKSGVQSLFIDYGNMISQIQDVTCYSILGEQTMKYNYPVNEISFAENSSEITLLVIRIREGETISFKILRL